MNVSSHKFRAWKDAEAELADIERRFRALASDLGPNDRARVTQQLAALKDARLRVQLLFEEVMRESASAFHRLAAEEAASGVPVNPPQQPRYRCRIPR